MPAPKTDESGIRLTIRALKAAGWNVAYVDDGGEEIEVSIETAAIDAITAVDQANLYVRKQGHRGRVFFVMGNSPEEVVADWTVNLSDVIDPLTESWWD